MVMAVNIKQASVEHWTSLAVYMVLASTSWPGKYINYMEWTIKIKVHPDQWVHSICFYQTCEVDCVFDQMEGLRLILPSKLTFVFI